MSPLSLLRERFDLHLRPLPMRTADVFCYLIYTTIIAIATVVV
ncbi:protein of unknown function [Vibrio tapetis subsp. tapetis]|uniref:Uncharacterized protein n=1 Tax=Vibrio tapetis subsp. tapetis TaxID=1671868 RepID=A0A2N8ZIV4_9VIBR|nr:protein of unknown function [Vibrio tapetis subsp. tapetis]